MKESGYFVRDTKTCFKINTIFKTKTAMYFLLVQALQSHVVLT